MGDVRARGRFRRTTWRRGHARGAGRAADLGTARPAQEADSDSQRRALLGSVMSTARPDGEARLHPRRLASHSHGGRACRGNLAETIGGSALCFRSGKADDAGHRRADVGLITVESIAATQRTAPILRSAPERCELDKSHSRGARLEGSGRASCFETHRSAAVPGEASKLAYAAMLLSMRPDGTA